MSDNILNSQIKVNKVGLCIYCGSGVYNPSKPGRRLGDEHAIPRSLLGYLVVPETCCKACEDKINPWLEEPITAHAMYGVRLMLGLVKKPVWKPIIVLSRDTGAAMVVKVPPSEFPVALSLPLFPLPLLCDPNAASTVGMRTDYFRVEEYAALCAKYPGKALFTWSFMPEAFARFIARVAHACAVAREGIEGFTPLLRDAIRDGSDVYRYVGGDPDSWPKTDYQHFAGTQWVEFDGKDYLLATIRLFSNLSSNPEVGSPVYRIYVGTRPSWSDRDGAVAHWSTKPDSEWVRPAKGTADVVIRNKIVVGESTPRATVWQTYPDGFKWPSPGNQSSQSEP